MLVAALKAALLRDMFVVFRGEEKHSATTGVKTWTLQAPANFSHPHQVLFNLILCAASPPPSHWNTPLTFTEILIKQL